MFDFHMIKIGSENRELRSNIIVERSVLNREIKAFKRFILNQAILPFQFHPLNSPIDQDYAYVCFRELQ